MREHLRIAAVIMLAAATVVALASATRRVPATPDEMVRFAPVFADQAVLEHAAAIAEGIRTHASVERFPIVPSTTESYLFYLPKGEGDAQLVVAPVNGRIYETVRIVVQAQTYYYLPEHGMMGIRV